MEKGSPYDMAAMYTTLTNTLQRLSDIKPCQSDKSLAGVKFEADKSQLQVVKVPKLGKVIKESDEVKQTQNFQLDLTGTWVNDGKMCQNTDLSNPQYLQYHTR